MDRKQYFTKCKYCGAHILMVRNIDTGRYTPCDPEIQWMIPLVDGDEIYIDQDGKKRFGAYSTGTAEPGYKKHSFTCTRRTA